MFVVVIIVEYMTNSNQKIFYQMIIRLCQISQSFTLISFVSVEKSPSLVNQVTAFHSSIGQHLMNNPVGESNYNDAMLTVTLRNCFFTYTVIYPPTHFLCIIWFEYPASSLIGLTYTYQYLAYHVIFKITLISRSLPNWFHLKSHDI